MSSLSGTVQCFMCVIVISTYPVGIPNGSYSIVQSVFVQHATHLTFKITFGAPTAHRWTFRFILKFLRDGVLPSDATLLTQVRTAYLFYLQESLSSYLYLREVVVPVNLE